MGARRYSETSPQTCHFARCGNPKRLSTSWREDWKHSYVYVENSRRHILLCFQSCLNTVYGRRLNSVDDYTTVAVTFGVCCAWKYEYKLTTSAVCGVPIRVTLRKARYLLSWPTFDHKRLILTLSCFKEPNVKVGLYHFWTDGNFIL